MADPKAKIYKLQATCYGPPWNAMNGTGVTAGGTDLTDGPEAYIVAIPLSGSPLKMGDSVFIEPNPVTKSKTQQFKVDDKCPGCAANQIDIYNWKGRASQYGWGKRTVTVTVNTVNPVTTADVVADKAMGFADPLLAIAAAIGDIVKFLALLVTPSFWLRVGKILLGAVLILMGSAALVKALLGIDLPRYTRALVKQRGIGYSVKGRGAGTGSRALSPAQIAARERAKVVAREGTKSQIRTAERKAKADIEVKKALDFWDKLSPEEQASAELSSEVQ